MDFDLVIIGAGINGAGIARDAAMRGLKVLLLDKGDVGGGTTSWSTRLIHGGLRYLEHGEIGLVRESLREREVLLRIAPHLVKPLPILIPIYKGARRGKSTIRAGMFAYDVLSIDKSLKRHRMLSKSEAIELAPALSTSDLNGAALFYDAQVEFPERLVVENVLNAQCNDAAVMTYARVIRLRLEGKRVEAVEFIDSSGSAHAARPLFVVNAAGPWIDQVLQNGSAPGERLIGGTKGSHIVVKPFPLNDAIYVEAQSDGRPFFIIPWNDKILIGTTDIRFDGDPDLVAAENSEIEYLLKEANRVLPAAQLTRDDILYTYSGVRPLPFTAEKDEQSITRRHFIREHPGVSNLVSIVGGKLTTYRNLAEQCVDLLFEKLGRQNPGCRTAEVRLPGADGLAFTDDPLQQRLQRIYGSRASNVLALADTDERLAEPLNEAGNAIAAEILFGFKSEFASTLGDVLMRRTMLGLEAHLGIGVDERAAKIAKEFLGWTDERAEDEVRSYRETIKKLL
ncbi:MAG: glycerol-3-phosphate dehydrogenase [Blastocatellia bacterium]|nr:MAG: glycerol-3-phosphate dehydrogenase [Blastocatellia bacterium]